MKSGKKGVQRETRDRQPSLSIFVPQALESQHSPDPGRQNKQSKRDNSFRNRRHPNEGRFEPRPYEQQQDRCTKHKQGSSSKTSFHISSKIIGGFPGKAQTMNVRRRQGGLALSAQAYHMVLHQMR